MNNKISKQIDQLKLPNAKQIKTGLSFRLQEYTDTTEKERKRLTLMKRIWPWLLSFQDSYNTKQVQGIRKLVLELEKEYSGRKPAKNTTKKKVYGKAKVIDPNPKLKASDPWDSDCKTGDCVGEQQKQEAAARINEIVTQHEDDEHATNALDGTEGENQGAKGFEPDVVISKGVLGVPRKYEAADDPNDPNELYNSPEIKADVKKHKAMHDKSVKEAETEVSYAELLKAENHLDCWNFFRGDLNNLLDFCSEHAIPHNKKEKDPMQLAQKVFGFVETEEGRKMLED